MLCIVYGNSQTGEVDETAEPVESVGFTYSLLRDDKDNTLAEYASDGLWHRLEDGTTWTDIDIHSLA